MKKSNIICLLTVLIFSIVGCTKEGEEGPQGPAGPQGPQGPDATVINYTVNNWGSVPDILEINNSNIVSTGAVLGYIYNSDWYSLPYHYSQGGGVFTIYRSSFDNGVFRIRVIDTDNSSTTQSQLLSTPRSIRIVVIPQRLINPDVDVNDYEAVKAAYNLKD